MANHQTLDPRLAEEPGGVAGHTMSDSAIVFVLINGSMIAPASTRACRTVVGTLTGIYVDRSAPLFVQAFKHPVAISQRRFPACEAASSASLSGGARTQGAHRLSETREPRGVHACGRSS